ncbi:DUF4293 domain-containing protein [Capnocytophaga sp. oral taxon 878]|uniref:DUF4293 domain-containing protein n=1 Tax=Capnocytophaga sp. oral taxon 878 TaxID=1316596 RepID=UPI000D030B47|nr:DUF4293 domain-containing protein [Capnocytophaga sp. oral taxon 878]AVM49746.1 DUF4293 domain-containing protein [Capnocytophaga sp. oral taxon 878]
MIQRIQTVYMAGAAIVAILAVIINLDWLRMALLCASAVLAIYAIFRYKARNVQMWLNWLNIAINFTLLGIFVYRMLTTSGEGFLSEKGVGVFVPVLSIVFLFSANKAIKRDEKLVKSADRLR